MPPRSYAVFPVYVPKPEDIPTAAEIKQNPSIRLCPGFVCSGKRVPCMYKARSMNTAPECFSCFPISLMND